MELSHISGQIIEFDLWLSHLAAGSQTQGLPGIARSGSRYVRYSWIGPCDVISYFCLADDDEPEWMIEFAKRDSRRAIAEKRQEFEARLAKIKQEEERLKAVQHSSERPRKKQVRSVQS
jgi:hypothetical protein